MTDPGATVTDLPVEVSPLYAQDAERAILAEILYRPAAIREACAVLAPQDFADHRFGQVWALTAGLVSAAADPDTIDALAVQAELTRRRLTPSGTKWLTASEWGDLLTAARWGLGRWEGHAKLILDAAIRRRVVAAAQRTIQDAWQAADAAAVSPAAAARFIALRDDHTPAGRLATRTLRDILDTDDPGYNWVIPGLLERSDRLVLTGEEGLGKSTLLRQIVICAAAGIHPLALTPIPPVTVVVVDAENSERQWRRKVTGMVHQARRHGTADPRDTIHLACVGRMDLTGPADLAAVHRLLDEHAPDILVIGPLYKLLPKAINSDDDAAPLIATLDGIRDRGPCLLMEAHAGHALTGAGGSRDLRPRGSAALLGWPEFGFGIARNTGEPDHLVDVRRWRGDRDERDWPAQLIRGGPFPWSDETVPAARRDAFRAGGVTATGEWTPTTILDDPREDY
jgi:hypothetical protein